MRTWPSGTIAPLNQATRVFASITPSLSDLPAAYRPVASGGSTPVLLRGPVAPGISGTRSAPRIGAKLSTVGLRCDESTRCRLVAGFAVAAELAATPIGGGGGGDERACAFHRKCVNMTNSFQQSSSVMPSDPHVFDELKLPFIFVP